MKLAILVLAGLLGATQIAAADDQPEPQQPRRGMKLRRMLIEQFDRDGDGRLDQRERMRASRALARMSMRLGQGKQGQRGQRGNRGMRRQKLIQKYDLDGDGNLGPGELPPRVQQRLRRMDRNGDGWLDQRDSAATSAAPGNEQ